MLGCSEMKFGLLLWLFVGKSTLNRMGLSLSTFSGTILTTVEGVISVNINKAVLNE